AALTQRLHELPPARRHGMLVDLVRNHVAAVLGHTSAETVSTDQTFRDLGFDSLTATELRNRLQDATGLRMDVTVIFDYPTATELGEYPVEELAVPAGKGDPAATSEDRTQPGSTNGDEPADTLVTLYLQALEAGRASDGRSLLEAASRILPVFD